MPSRIVPIVAVAVLGGLATARPAAADAEVLEVDPPAVAVGTAALAAPVAPASRLGFYAEMMLGYGHLRSELVSPNNGYRSMTGTDTRGLRWALGARISEGAMDVRLGAVVDVVSASGTGAAIGVELQADWAFAAGWRAGGRISGAIGNGNGDPTTLDGNVGCAGIRLRKDAAIIGVDAVRVWHPDGHATGGMLTIGFGGRPGKYLVGASAGATAVLAILAMASFAGATTH